MKSNATLSGVSLLISIVFFAVAILAFLYLDIPIVGGVLAGVASAFAVSALFNAGPDQADSVWLRLFMREPERKGADFVIITVSQPAAGGFVVYRGILEEFFFQGDRLEKVVLQGAHAKELQKESEWVEVESEYSVLQLNTTDVSSVDIDYVWMSKEPKKS